MALFEASSHQILKKEFQVGHATPYTLNFNANFNDDYTYRTLRDNRRLLLARSAYANQEPRCMLRAATRLTTVNLYAPYRRPPTETPRVLARSIVILLIVRLVRLSVDEAYRISRCTDKMVDNGSAYVTWPGEQQRQRAVQCAQLRVVPINLQDDQIEPSAVNQAVIVVNGQHMGRRGSVRKITGPKSTVTFSNVSDPSAAGISIFNKNLHVLASGLGVEGGSGSGASSTSEQQQQAAVTAQQGQSHGVYCGIV
ncbi:hypothetical protein JKP88DRAFT_255950 [Tribonema minus]|uniref:Uncharacterized protein n=1 Tax=Tribonema minus TaxID=303371 RepID=A0A836CFW0_9STRA|nr:hypothetical protein JKP88DRAFT_255950 [Tribonema minus]